MGFHCEYTDDGGRWHRTGTHQTKEDALRAAVQDQHRPVLILEDESDAISHGRGEVVAAVLPDGGVVEEIAEPAWWGRVTDDVHARALASDNADGIVAAITEAGGWAVATRWEGQPLSDWQLSVPDENWLQVEKARREIQASCQAN